MPFARPFSLLLFLGLAGCTSDQNTPAEIVAPATTAQLVRQSGVAVLDVRDAAEYQAGHLHNARNIDFRSADFAAQTARLDTSATYVLYCASGNRSGKAALLMQQQGFRHLVNAGGFKTLQENGLPTD